MRGDAKRWNDGLSRILHARVIDAAPTRRFA